MRSKYLVLSILVLFSLVLQTYAQQRPRGGSPTSTPSRSDAERSLAEQRRELRSLEMMGNNPYKESNPVMEHQMRLRKELTELNQATLSFLQLFNQEYQTMADKGEMKELGKLADKVAKCSKKLREDLELEDFKVKINPLEFALTEPRNEQMMKIARNINELIEQINISQATKNASEIKLKVLARHLTALETHATSAKEVAKNKD